MLGVVMGREDKRSKTFHNSAECAIFERMSHVRAIYHIVINTKNRMMTIPDAYKRELYAYIYGILKANNCLLYRINGTRNHIHMLIDLHPSVALSSLMQSIKQSSSKWLKSNANFPYFGGWGKEYYAATIARDRINDVIEYIKNQESHHYSTSFETEIEQIFATYGLPFNKEYLT